MEGFRFGTAIREITPAHPVWMHGCSNRNHESTGVAEPIYTGFLAVEDGLQTALIITTDMIGIGIRVCQELYELLEGETGTPPVRTCSSAPLTRTTPLHSTPLASVCLAWASSDPIRPL